MGRDRDPLIHPLQAATVAGAAATHGCGHAEEQKGHRGLPATGDKFHPPGGGVPGRQAQARGGQDPEAGGEGSPVTPPTASQHIAGPRNLRPFVNHIPETLTARSEKLTCVLPEIKYSFVSLYLNISV